MEKEIKDVLDETKQAITAINEELERKDGKMDAIGKEVFKKASKAVNDAVEKIQEVEQKNIANEERIKELELLQAKGKDPEKEFGREEKQAYAEYLRSGKPMSDELYRKSIAYNVENKMDGLSVKEKELYIEKEMENYSQTKEMSQASGANGGYTVIPEYDMTMRTRMFETSPMRSVASVHRVGDNNSSVVLVLDDDEAAAGHVGETDARPTTDSPGIGQVTIPLGELYAKPRATQTILDRSPWMLGGYLGNKAIDRINRYANYDYILGAGTDRAKGILAYSAWSVAGTYERNKVEQVTGTDTTSGFNGDDLITLQNTLTEEYQAGASLLCSRLSFSEVMKLKGTDGHYMFDRYELLNGAKCQVLGKPVVIMNDMPTIATGSLSFAYGDFKAAYMIADGMGFRILRDPYSAKPYVEFYTTFNTGGGVMDFSAYKILKMNTVT